MYPQCNNIIKNVKIQNRYSFKKWTHKDHGEKSADKLSAIEECLPTCKDNSVKATNVVPFNLQPQGKNLFYLL
jgi:hypothetical protein